MYVIGGEPLIVAGDEFDPPAMARQENPSRGVDEQVGFEGQDAMAVHWSMGTDCHTVYVIEM
jgi:hypothetical protein